MVTWWLARALLSVAARRWPVELRDEMRAEWLAELHVLASPPQPVRMLRFAASLALTRPRLGARMPFLDPELTVGQVARHALLVLLTLVATIHLSVSAPFAAGLLIATVPVLLAVPAGASSPLLRPGAVVVAIMVPATGALVTAPLIRPYLNGPWDMPAATGLWAALLAGILLLASRFRVRTAVVLAGLGGLAACWLATTVATLPHANQLSLDTGYAVLWYPAELLWPLDVPMGDPPPSPSVCTADVCVPHPAPIDRLMDFSEGYPAALTITTAFVAAYVIASAATIDGPGRPAGAPVGPGRVRRPGAQPSWEAHEPGLPGANGSARPGPRWARDERRGTPGTARRSCRSPGWRPAPLR